MMSSNLRTYSRAEERVHVLSHALGLLGSIVGAVVLFGAAAKSSFASRAACGIYAASLVLMYLASTAYHLVPAQRVRIKQTLRALDHCSIFTLIAGTYSAFALTVLHGALARALLIAMWGLCAAGVHGVWRRGRMRRGPILLSLAMGWLVAPIAPEMAWSLGTTGTLLVLAGGILYTLGVPFYAWRGLPHHHGIWHVFVLFGSLNHFLAVVLFVLPRMP
jgi:hemolysin III